LLRGAALVAALVADVSAAAGPGALLSPGVGPPTTTVTVSSSGFLSGEEVEVFDERPGAGHGGRNWRARPGQDRGSRRDVGTTSGLSAFTLPSGPKAPDRPSVVALVPDRSPSPNAAGRGG
jgi:hypothetical protein